MAQQVKASYFDDKEGCYGNNIYNRGYDYAELSKDY